MYTEGLVRPYIRGETQILADLTGVQKCSMLFPVFLEILLLALLLAVSATGRSYTNAGYFLCSLLLIYFVALGYYRGRPLSAAKEKKRLRKAFRPVMRLSMVRMRITIITMVLAVVITIIKLSLIFSDVIPREVDSLENMNFY